MVLVLRAPMWRAMLVRLSRRTTMVESENLAVSLLSERRGPNGGLRLSEPPETRMGCTGCHARAV